MTLFSDLIRGELERVHLSHSQFSRRIDVPERVVGTWLREGRLPSPRYIPRVADFFSIDAGMLTRVVAAEDDLTALDEEAIRFLADRDLSPLAPGASAAEHRFEWRRALAEAEEASQRAAGGAHPPSSRSKRGSSRSYLLPTHPAVASGSSRL